MLGIGMSELLVILVIALIFVGPQKLPQLVSWLGKGLAEFRKEADDLKNTIVEDQDISTPTIPKNQTLEENPSEEGETKQT